MCGEDFVVAKHVSCTGPLSNLPLHRAHMIKHVQLVRAVASCNSTCPLLVRGHRKSSQKSSEMNKIILDVRSKGKGTGSRMMPML